MEECRLTKEPEMEPKSPAVAHFKEADSVGFLRPKLK